MLVMRIAALQPSECEHAPSDNPRYRGSCRKCGRPMPVLARDREFERTLTREIAGGLGVDIEPLILLSEHRADAFQVEYGRDFPDLARSMEGEAIDELLDARNYLVWKLDAIHRGLAEGDVEQLQIALRHVAFAFTALRT